MMYAVIVEEAEGWVIKVITPDQEVAYQLATEAKGVVCPLTIERDWREPK